MESNQVPKEIYQTTLKILSDVPFSADVFGGLNREVSIPNEQFTSAITGIQYAFLLGNVRAVTLMQMYEHAKIEPGKTLSPERSQTTIHFITDDREVFYEFERNTSGLIESRKVLYRLDEREVTETGSLGLVQSHQSSETLPLYNTYEWVMTDPELIALNGLTKALLSQGSTI